MSRSRWEHLGARHALAIRAIRAICAVLLHALREVCGFDRDERRSRARLAAPITTNMRTPHCIHLPIVERFFYDVPDIHRRFNNLRVDST